MNVSLQLLLVILGRSAYGYNECDKGLCGCCKNNSCQRGADSYSYCAEGCEDGYYGQQCKDACMNSCATCTNSYTCDSCKPGTICPYNCYTEERCTSCLSFDTCRYCKTGFYGTQCKNRCSGGCRNICRSSDGACDCKSGYTGETCNECIAGIYGPNCDRLCLTNCLTCSSFVSCSSCRKGFWGPACWGHCPTGCVTCHKSTAVCNGDCKDGYFGNECKACLENCKRCSSAMECLDCKPKYWGLTCQSLCPPNCQACTSNTFCSSCSKGFYGYICNNSCPENCKDGECDSFDGTCALCNTGFFGKHCGFICPERCTDRLCYQYNGACRSCISGFYGVNCSKSCHENCLTCSSDIHCTGCVTGYKGQSCQDQCIYCKKGSPCNQWDGSCDECNDGLYGRRCTVPCSSVCKSCNIHFGYCTECTNGKYGKYGTYGHCLQDCPRSCLNITCDMVTGHCDHGCVKGYWGDMCNKRCSENCKDQLCSRSNGHCLNGCMEGYTQPQCTCPVNCECYGMGLCYKCKNSFVNINRNCTCRKDIGVCFTEKCESCSLSDFYPENSACCPCSKNCRNNVCESASKCSFGCKEGFRGHGCSNHCKEIDYQCSICTVDYGSDKGKCLKCIDGYYLSAASTYCLSCSDGCINKTCNGTNGRCTFGCKEGRWGTKCEKHCSENCLRCNQTNGTCLLCKSGKYMSDCSKPCSINCSGELCAIENGACLNGCDSPVKYGIYCNNKCNINCVNNTCDWKTGFCAEGCVFNHYGEKCTNECNVNCKEMDGASPCDQSTGYCVTACKDGYYGNFCDHACSSNCLNGTCQKISGTCVLGCTYGYKGSSCLQEVLNESASSMKIGVAAGVIVLVVIIFGVALAILLIRSKRNKRRKSESSQLNDNNLQNSAVSYSVVSASRIDVEENDAVYAKPNKLKKKTNEDMTMISNSNSQMNALKSENDEWKTVSKSRTKNENRTVLPDRKNTHEIEGAVYTNTEIGETVIKTIKAKNKLRQGLTSVFEVEEDLSNITALANDMGLIQNEYDRKTNEGDYYNLVDLKKRKVPLDKLAEYVTKKTKKDFKEEFDKLPAGLIKPFTESQKPENLTKNRYRALYPYDKTRVILKGLGSDYINASFIDGYKKTKAYIASIGPTSKYMGDMSAFWRMIWQERVGKIVMLTKLSEAGVPKCDQYWPETDCRLIFDDIQVTAEREEIYADYAVRCLTVRKDSAARKIVQVHFTAWPDKGIPGDVTNLVEFRQKVNNITTDLDGPIVVHCSAGVGRTGTYIAIDSISKEGEAEGRVDIYACVRNLREQRVNMVQTAEQYQFLHNAVVHILLFECKPITASMFHGYMSTHTADQLECQFQRLQASVKRTDDEMEAVRMNKTLKDKNRIGADIPGENNRPRIFLRRAQTMSGYINALYINSFRTVNRFLVAQTPLPNTVEDFLTLIVQEKVSCVVDMDPSLSENKTVGSYYPVEKQNIRIGSVTVQSVKEESMGQYKQRKLKILYQGKSVKEEVQVTHIQYTECTEKKKIPEDPKSFMQFVKDIDTICDDTRNKGPILVHCLTGAEKSGLFCVVSILLEKMQVDQEVSVVNTVCQVKNRRHKSIPNKEQFIFCHQCLDKYLHTFDTYSNFCLAK